MTVNSRDTAELCPPRKCQDREASPERSMIWVEPRLKKSETKVSVVYYLSRDGQLEHPHFIEVPLSSPYGLHLRDVLNRLNLLRGHGMANMYSWSSKRSYKKGFVWQDLSEDDFIHPSHGHEYILKGSQIPENPITFRSSETASSSTPRPSPETNSSVKESNFPAPIRGTKQSWSPSLSSDDDRKDEYRVETAARKSAADVATQTGDERPETGGSADIRDRTAGNDRASGRIRASAVVMQLISCGSTRVDDWEESTERSSFG